MDLLVLGLLLIVSAGCNIVLAEQLSKNAKALEKAKSNDYRDKKGRYKKAPVKCRK